MILSIGLKLYGYAFLVKNMTCKIPFPVQCWLPLKILKDYLAEWKRAEIILVKILG